MIILSSVWEDAELMPTVKAIMAGQQFIVQPFSFAVYSCREAAWSDICMSCRQPGMPASMSGALVPT